MMAVLLCRLREKILLIFDLDRLGSLAPCMIPRTLTLGRTLCHWTLVRAHSCVPGGFGTTLHGFLLCNSPFRTSLARQTLDGELR